MNTMLPMTWAMDRALSEIENSLSKTDREKLCSRKYKLVIIDREIWLIDVCPGSLAGKEDA